MPLVQFRNSFDAYFSQRLCRTMMSKWRTSATDGVDGWVLTKSARKRRFTQKLHAQKGTVVGQLLCFDGTLNATYCAHQQPVAVSQVFLLPEHLDVQMATVVRPRDQFPRAILLPVLVLREDVLTMMQILSPGSVKPFSNDDYSTFPHNCLNVSKLPSIEAPFMFFWAICKLSEVSELLKRSLHISQTLTSLYIFCSVLTFFYDLWFFFEKKSNNSN